MKYYKYIDQGWGDSKSLRSLELTEDDYYVRYDELTGRWHTLWMIFGRDWIDAEEPLVACLKNDIQKGLLVEVPESEAFIDLL